MPHPYLTRVIAGQLSRFTRYYDAVVQFAPLPNDDGSLLKQVDCATKATAGRIEDVPAGDAASGTRSYGATNIHRFRHGLMLLRMTLIGLLRVKCGAGPRR